MPLLVLCSAPADEESRDTFVTHLEPWVQDGGLTLWHEGCIPPGATVAAERAAHAQRADVVCVLCSKDLLADRERLADVRAALVAGRRVVPLIIRPCLWNTTVSPLCGLQPLPRDGRPLSSLAAAAAEEVWTQITEALIDSLRERPPLTRDGPLRPFLSAALKLDRGRQWTRVIERCAQPEPTLFFLGGHVRQRVNLFADRVCDHLERERPPRDRHRVVLLTYRDGAHCPHTAAEWERRFSEAIGAVLGRKATPPELLRRAAEDRPLFVVLGRRPFRQALLGEAEAGLRDFLAASLPRLLLAQGAAHPVRVLVLAEYTGPRDHPLLGRLEAAVAEARAAGLPGVVLPEPGTPGREDIAQLLSTYDPPPDPAAVARVWQAFEDLIADGGSPDLNDIARTLGPLNDEEDDG